MRVASLARKIIEAKSDLSAMDKQRLLQLIYDQQDAELGRWYYELNGGRAPEL